VAPFALGEHTLYRLYSRRNCNVAVTGTCAALSRALQGISFSLSLLTAKDIVNEGYSILKRPERAIVRNYQTSPYEWFPVSTVLSLAINCSLHLDARYGRTGHSLEQHTNPDSVGSVGCMGTFLISVRFKVRLEYRPQTRKRRSQPNRSQHHALDLSSGHTRSSERHCTGYRVSHRMGGIDDRCTLVLFF
jgi:hypothetical protein